MKFCQLVYFYEKNIKKIFRVGASKKSKKTVRTSTLVFLVNHISRYHVLYIFRKRKDQTFEQKNKMGVFRFLSLVIYSKIYEFSYESKSYFND